MAGKEESKPKDTPTLKDVGHEAKDWFAVGPKAGTK